MARFYGPAGIPMFWIVNLVARQVELYALNRRCRYGKARIFKSGQFVPVMIDGANVGRIAVDDVMPPLATAA
jgi:hypothetical protein